MSEWHALNEKQVAEILAVDSTHGLEEADASSRLKKHGPNRQSA